MAQLQIVYLLRPGTQEQWRRLYQEVAESRREQFEESCRHIGITQVQVRLVQMLHDDLMLITLHMQEPQQTLAERALYVHPEGCPAHQSVKAAIRITWDATLHVGEEVIRLSSEAPLE